MRPSQRGKTNNVISSVSKWAVVRGRTGSRPFAFRWSSKASHEATIKAGRSEGARFARQTWEVQSDGLMLGHRLRRWPNNKPPKMTIEGARG